MLLHKKKIHVRKWSERAVTKGIGDLLRPLTEYSHILSHTSINDKRKWCLHLCD